MKQFCTRLFALILLISVVCFSSCATTPQQARQAQQAQQDSRPGAAEPAESGGILQSLRRAEIVFFGSLPFSYLFSGLGIDIYRWGKGGWQQFQFGATTRTMEENWRTLAISAGLSLTAALTDFIIVQSQGDE
jgi:ABC-type Fe3+ transport system permease subunit